MSLGITAAVVGIAAGGVALGNTVNNLVSGGSSSSSGSKSSTGSSSANTSTTTASQAADNALSVAALTALDKDVQTQTAIIETEDNDELQQQQTGEYITLGLAAVSLVCFLFLQRK